MKTIEINGIKYEIIKNEDEWKNNIESRYVRGCRLLVSILVT